MIGSVITSWTQLERSTHGSDNVAAVEMTEAPRFQLSRWIFLRLLGLTYLLAFASLGFQITGLIGTDGLLPVAQFLDRAGEFYGGRAYYLLPTLLWVSASDVALQVLCWGGVVLAGLAMAGITPVVTFALLWLFYLSLSIGGQTFLSFQWDTLLLETGLLACLYAPRGWWPGLATERQPSIPIRWLIWGLAFKVTFLSGVTKLVSGDQTWRGLTALTYHYQTQPIPAWTSWFAHHLPLWLHQASAIGMLATEMVVPFLILVPARRRRTKLVACGLLCLLQVAIGMTGNYGFFNLLTCALYLTLLDDGYIRRVLPNRLVQIARGRAAVLVEPAAWRAVLVSAALIIGIMSSLTLWREATYTRPHAEWSNRLVGLVQPTRSINGYGLFRTMTTERPEIMIEGTADGENWTEYAFRWKPGDLGRRPGFVQPHMPRLDWLMWFAALDPFAHQHWLGPLVEHLLVGSPTVVGLLAADPFAGTPPMSVRLAIYDYRFTTPDEGLETGHWWRREFRAYLTEPMSLP